MGGFIASAYAARYPDEVITLGLIAPHGMVEPEPSELFRDVAKGDNWLVATTRQEFDRLLNNVFAKRPYRQGGIELSGRPRHPQLSQVGKDLCGNADNDPPSADRLAKSLHRP